jgi:hypothetical protein
MAWYADLSPCDYFGDENSTHLRAVGWLERGQPFITGPIDPLVFIQIADLLKDPWQPFQFRGLHRCDLCLYQAELLGTRNLFIPSNGVVYVCPELITHYMNAHGYRPPDEFCRAVLACPPMRSMAYYKALMDNGAKPLLASGYGGEGLHVSRGGAE